jgi:hypothetical protein
MARNPHHERPFPGETRTQRMREEHMTERRGDHRPTNTPDERLEQPHYKSTYGDVRNPSRRGGGRD